MPIDLEQLVNDPDYKQLSPERQREVLQQAIQRNLVPQIGAGLLPGQTLQGDMTKPQGAPAEPSPPYSAGSGIAVGANGQPVFTEPGSMLTQPESALNQAVRGLNRYGPPLVAGYLTGGMSYPVQLGAQLGVTALQQATGIEPRSGVAPYVETILSDTLGRAAYSGLQGLLKMFPPGKKYLADQDRLRLGSRISQQAEQNALEQAQFQRQIEQAIGQGTQRQAQIAGGQEALTTATQQGITRAELLTRQAQEGYGLVRSALTKTGDDLARYKQLQQLQLRRVREEGAVSARQWLDTLPVPDEAMISKLYADVDAFNGQRMPAQLVTSLNSARQELAAKEARIAGLVPEATNPELRRLGQAGSAMAPGQTVTSPVVDAAGRPIITEVAPTPPTFQGVRETLVRLGQRIGDARAGVNTGQTGAREELAALSKLYGTLQQGLDQAITSGDLTPAAKTALQEANAAFKVAATTEDLRGLLASKIRTPEGGTEVFNPAAVLDALQRPQNKDLRDKLAEIGVLPQLQTFLADLQGKLAAPKDAVLKARELEYTAKGIYRQLQPAEQQALESYAQSKRALQQYQREGTALAQGEQAAVGQQAQAQAEMLQSQAQQAQQAGQTTLGDLQRRQAAVPNVTMNTPFAMGYGPAAVGGLAALQSGSPQTGLAVAAPLEAAALLGRLLMTPRGQDIVGKVLEGSGGVFSPHAMAVLFQVAKDPIMAVGSMAGTQIRELGQSAGSEYSQRYLSPVYDWLRQYGRQQAPAK